MENIFKELFLSPSQGVSLSIADAKVDTFCKLTKHYYNFLEDFFNKISKSLIYSTNYFRPDFIAINKMTSTHYKTYKIAFLIDSKTEEQ